MRLTPLIFSLLLITSNICLSADPSNNLAFNFQPAAISRQLTQQTIIQVFQDSRGFLWILTQEGLSKYNGIEIESYQYSASNPNSISSNSVTRITEDAHGAIWISTDGGGLNRYHARNNTFSALYATGQPNESPLSNTILTVFADQLGNLWLGYNGAFSSYEPTTGRFIHYLSSSLGVNLGAVNRFDQSSDGTIWIATEGGLLELEPKSQNIRIQESNAETPVFSISNNIKSVTVDDNDRVWAVTRDEGVIVINVRNREVTHYRYSDIDPGSLSSNLGYDSFKDHDGRMWIGTHQGLNLFIEEDGSFTKYTKQNSGLPSDTISSIFQSREGKYWVGTFFGLASGTKPFFTKIDMYNGGLSSESINAFSETADGSLWIATDDGLNRLRPGQQNFEWINESTYPRISGPDVMSLLAVGNTLWVGTFNSGLNKLNIDSNTTEVYFHNNIDKHSVGANGITSMIETSEGQILVGTFGGGISIYREGTDDFITLKHQPSDGSSLSNNNVIALFQDSFGMIWVGTEKGLNRLDLETMSFSRYTYDPDNSHSISSDMVWAFYEDADQGLWLGTNGGGLNLWDANNRKDGKEFFNRYSEIMSLPSSSIYGILSDQTGTLWLSHTKGISSYNPETHESSNYNVRDGLQDSEFNMGSAYKSKSGTLYFGGNKGFNTIPGVGVEFERLAPKLSISNIRIMNEKKLFDSAYHELEKLEIGYQDRMLSVEFFASDYSNPQLIQYAYKLEGINPDWVISPESHIASFTTLPPGKYNLKLAAASPNGAWNWDGLTLPIVVNPPPWLSPIAYTGYALVLVGFIALIFIRQNKQAQQAVEREKELQAKVAERTADLQEARQVAEEANKAKSTFLATISHEIRTPMHGMIGMTELLMHTNLSEQQRRFAEAAHNSGETLLNLINEILDFSKIEAAKVELDIIEFDPVELIDEICYLQAEPAHRRSLEIFSIFDPDIPIKLRGDPTKIRQIIMNLVSNSIKFTHEGSVTVRASRDRLLSESKCVSLNISVEDTGIGMDETTQQRVFDAFTQADASTTRQYGGTGLGLAISKQYVELMEGSIRVESSPGSGTKITVTIPLTVSQMLTEESNLLQDVSASLLSDSLETVDMLDSHLQRLGIKCGMVANPKDLTNESNRKHIIILDYAFLAKNPNSINQLHGVDDESVLVLYPFRVDHKFRELENWKSISKPITLSSLEPAIRELCQELDSGNSLQHTKNDEYVKFDGKVLVAEDVEINQRIATEMLQILNFSVVIAHNGEEAVKKYLETDFDLIFMDCQMPMMDGFEATTKIRELEEKKEKNRTPIIALTAGTGKEDRLRCMKSGMDDYLTKPFSISELQKTIFQYISKQPNRPESLPINTTIESEPADPSKLSEAVSDIINTRAIDNILSIESQTGKPLLPSILDGFIRQMGEKLTEIAANAAEKDSERLYRTAHAIKSMSANIGAERVRVISASIEKNARNGIIDNIDQSITELEISYDDFVGAFRDRYLTTKKERRLKPFS